MAERFIERGTDYPLRHGKLSVYETNCACKDIKFYFDQYVLTLMLAGHKTVVSENLKFEFFPGTFFIPEKEVINNVSIANATIDNPTKCLVLELDPQFIQSIYEEISYAELDRSILYSKKMDKVGTSYFSNDQLLIQAFIRLYDLQFQDHSASKELVEDLIIKEMLFRVFCTEGLHLLKSNFEKSIEDNSIKRAIIYINDNINQKISVKTLAKVAGLGQTTFFKMFKQCIGQSPSDYILRERIRQAKVLIQKGKLSLQEIAFRCGFNSYEYFCSSFKRIENLKPTEYRTESVGVV